MNKFIVKRPVNALRRVYEPAFLGAKIRAEKSSNLQINLMLKTIEKKLHSTEDWSYKDILVFKSINDDGSKVYRKCLVPSPSTSAAEAYLLNDLSKIRNNLRVRNVYSYKLADAGGAVNYEYFLEQYKTRNHDISKKLKGSPGSVALCFDIKSFYPSINKQLLEKKLKEFESKHASEKNLRRFVDFSMYQISRSESGVPIGTELSHQLADIYLSNFDNVFSEKYGSRYFRYVDDITVVCEKSEISNIVADVRSSISELGLVLNDGKYAEYSIEDWQQEVSNAAVEGEDFFEHCQELARWIGTQPNSLSYIERHFKDEGLNLPFSKIFARSKFLREKNERFTLNDIISKTLDLKQRYIESAESMVGMNAFSHSKGSLQRARRALNPLFYLLQVDQYDLILEVAETHNNLITQEIVSKALKGNNISELLEFPGTTVASFCEIAKVVESQVSKKFSNPSLGSLSNAALNSISSLAIHGLLDGSEFYDHEFKYLRPNVSIRSLTSVDFESEIETLRINLTSFDQEQLLGNRLDVDEEIGLPALDLGDQTISP